MAADVFGDSVNGEIDALLERAEEQRRCPGIVVDDKGASLVRDSRYRNRVSHLEGLGAGRLDEHRSRIRLEQRGDIAAEQRIEIVDLDAEMPQQPLAKPPRRPVHI